MLQFLIVDLNSFEIIDLIGKGPSGEVYLVEEKKTGNYYSAKVLNKSLSSPSLQKNFNDLIIFYSKILYHPIVKLYGFNYNDFNNESRPTIFTEYIENGSLNDLVQRNRQFPISKKYFIMLDLLLGLYYLHSQNVIHGSLKPSNVLIDKFNHPLIRDFGEIFNSNNNLNQKNSKTYFNSLIYQSPEVLSGKRPTTKSDIYSFSIIAYRLITNKSPFPYEESIENFKKKVINNERPNISNIKIEPLKRLLTKCWASKEEDRPSSDEIFKEMNTKAFIQSMNVDQEDIDFYLKLNKNMLPSNKNTKQTNNQQLPSSSLKPMSEIEKLTINILKILHHYEIHDFEFKKIFIFIY